MSGGQNLIYDDNKYIKRNKMASIILLLKMISTLPFNIIGLFKPESIQDYDWILFIEAFHHYHTRIFYLLALHRNMTQFYCAKYGNGLIQRRLILLEFSFDIGLILLYVHEYFALHNIKVFFTWYTMIHFTIGALSLYSLRITSNIKIANVS